MKIFLDTCNKDEIQKWLSSGVIDGVTTNPTILRREGHSDIERIIREIADIIDPLPLSVEVCSTEHEEMLYQGKLFASWAKNIVVKITVIDEAGNPCLETVKMLEESGIKVNCTACLSLNQAMFAAKAGASYISLFVGRINDEGNDGPKVVQMTKQWLDTWGFKSEIIAASVRNLVDVQQAALAGAHIITIPPLIMCKCIDHRYSRATVQQLAEDGRHFLDFAKHLC